MTDPATEAVLVRLYQAYADLDVATINALIADDLVMHVPGTHPLAGEHRGRDAAWTYLARVAEVSRGRGGFELHSVATDDDGHAVALLTGTIRDFVRPVVHIWDFNDDGLLVGYWEANLNQHDEDQFWIGALSE